MSSSDLKPEQSALGKKTSYENHYNPETLFAIPRELKRAEIGIIGESLPFHGYDLWNHYEVSWLNEKGKPIVALAEISYDCITPFIIESKSLKLYFNSFNNTVYASPQALAATIANDLTDRLKGKVDVNIIPLHQVREEKLHAHLVGECIDSLDVVCSTYIVDPALLAVESGMATEVLHSNLLKSNCLVTNQPDWGSVQIAYTGNKINRESLLRYIVSFRDHNEFHEQCIERIFIDLMHYCQPQALAVYGRYTRRGGIDINPFRTTDKNYQKAPNFRLCRQ